MQVLVLLDKPTYHALRQLEAPASKFSHDRHIFQFAHESLRKGLSVFCTPMQEDPYAREYKAIKSVYPEWTTGQSLTYHDINPDIVVSVFPESLNIRSIFPFSKIVAIHAAVHWAESPETFSDRYVYDIITAVRYNIDFILTQNYRMKSLLESTYGLLAKWQHRDRIISCPLSIVEEERKATIDRALARRQMGLARSDIAIVNSGGIWRWTDFNNFLLAFCEYSNRTLNSKLKLFISGFRQPGNHVHDDYHIHTQHILQNNRHLIGRVIFSENIWHQGSNMVDIYSAGADVGINISQDSLEHWQSYRVRFLEYLTQGRPVINSTGDAMSNGPAAQGMYLVQPGDKEGYVNTLRMIDRDPGKLRVMAQAMKKCAPDFDSRRTYGETIQRIVDTPRRPESDSGPGGPCVLDRANDLAREQVLGAVRTRLQEYLMAGV